MLRVAHVVANECLRMWICGKRACSLRVAPGAVHRKKHCVVVDHDRAVRYGIGARAPAYAVVLVLAGSLKIPSSCGLHCAISPVSQAKYCRAASRLPSCRSCTKKR